MDRPDDESDRPVQTVSDAVAKKYLEGTLRDRIRDGWTWVLVDANRWLVVAALAVGVFAATFAVSVLGPLSQDQYLIAGTQGAKAYVELQTIAVTVMTITLSVNQLVLAPQLGPVSRQRERIESAVSHRFDAEDASGATVAPTDPPAFVRAIVAATRDRAAELREATADLDDADREAVAEAVAAIVDDVDAVDDALARQSFGDVGFLGATAHYDTTRDVHRLRELRNDLDDALSPRQRKAFEDLVESLELFEVSREYFRTLHVQSEFVRFSRAILYVGPPALLVAHYSVNVIGPNALPGEVFGVRALLWYEICAFTVTTLPVLVLVSFVARLVTLAELSLFVGPFVPESDVEVERGRGEE